MLRPCILINDAAQPIKRCFVISVSVIDIILRYFPSHSQLVGVRLAKNPLFTP